ncbi:hypothetical protein [uncultured Ellagibacter sp.]|uniref:hypothetical protein n=1 Tax=uncultured Ellagibacter sp. TaxID=2137580 RepID=UPI0026375EB0|nr:hypothetical protein [uncultured Ellagibacter sp.]
MHDFPAETNRRFAKTWQHFGKLSANKRQKSIGKRKSEKFPLKEKAGHETVTR